MQDRKLRILVVDDKKMIADVLAIILRGHGWEVRTAYGGREAVDSSFGFRPDIVLSDVEMDDLDGIDACAQIRESLPECRFLLFTGQVSTDGMIAKAREKGIGSEIIPKPIDPRVVLSALDAIFAERHVA